MFSKKEIKEKIQEIFYLYQNVFLLPNGLPGRYVDGQSGEIAYQESLLADFGDYIPFFLYFKKDKKMSRFCSQQLALAEKEIKKDPLKRTYWGIDLVHAFEYDDLLFGLYLYYLLSRGKKAKNLAAFILKNHFERFFVNRGFSSFYLPQFKLSLPVVNCLLGGFIEIYALFYKEFKKEKYLKRAEKLAGFFIENSFFKKFSLFPHHILPFACHFPGLKTNEVTLMKDNTATVWGLLELYKAANDEKIKKAILKWLSGFNSFLPATSLPAQTIYFKRDKPTVQKTTLTAGFAAVDLLCDLSFFLKSQPAIKTAESIASAWLSLQNQQTGLLPLYPEGKISFLDSETDMSIALFKLYELTGRKAYQRKALKILQGIFKYHYQKNGYALGVNIESGKITRPKSNVKFNALLIKPLIYLLEKRAIYENPLLFELLKDR